MKYTKSRRVLKITSFAFILVMVLIALFAEHSISSCDGENSFTVQLLAEEREYIVKDGKSDYTIVFSASDAFQVDTDLAKDLSMQIRHNYGATVRYRPDSSTQESAYEILIGETDREISLKIAAEVASLTEDKNLVYIIAESNGKLACVANSVEAYAKAKEEMLALLGKDSFSVTKGLYITFTMTRAEYDKEIADKEAADKESKIEAIKDKIGAFDDFTLLDFILAQEGNLNESADKGEQESAAETIENNIRKKVVQKIVINPAYYSKMSEVLEQLILDRKQGVLEYKQLIARYIDLCKNVEKPEENEKYPASIAKSAALRSLYDNCGENEELAVKLHGAIMKTKMDGFRNNPVKENKIKRALYQILNDEAEVERLYKIIIEQEEY